MIEQIDKVKVKFTPKSKGLYAIATLEMKGGWTIKGYRIRESNKYHEKFKEHVWITAPSYLGTGGYKSIIYIPTNEWEKVEELIFKAYKKRRAEESISYNVDEIE